ncbi:hypothetical protein [Pedobacter sp.]
MQIDVPNSELVQYPVKGTQGLQVNQTVTFANYQTQYIKRSWNKGISRAFGFSTGQQSFMLGTEKKKSEMTFALTAKTGENAEIFMTNALKSRNLFVETIDKAAVNAKRYRAKDSLLNSCYAPIYLADAEKPWQMQINNAQVEMNKNGVVGKITLDKDNYCAVKTVIKTKPKSISKIPVGFQFENKNGEIVAAVSLLDNGTIFLKKDDEKEKLLLSSAALVLLLRADFVD